MGRKHYLRPIFYESSHGRRRERSQAEQELMYRSMLKEHGEVRIINSNKVQPGREEQIIGMGYRILDSSEIGAPVSGCMVAVPEDRSEWERRRRERHERGQAMERVRDTSGFAPNMRESDKYSTFVTETKVEKRKSKKKETK